jgi:hypothetical protein
MTLPGWNAHVKVENATEVGLGWAVTDDMPGDPLDYHAMITLTLPLGAGAATVVAQKPNETVALNRDPSLACGPNGIQAIVTYDVSTESGNGRKVEVKVCKNAGQKPPPAGDILGAGTGEVDQVITVDVLIPGTCA